MRTVFAIALCFLLGGCATFGGGEFDPYGMYDLVSINGAALPTMEVTGGWYELRPDGTSTVTMDIAEMPDQEAGNADFSLGEMEDGCFPFRSTGEDGSEWTGSICGDVFTVEGNETTVVMHKRR